MKGSGQGSAGLQCGESLCPMESSQSGVLLEITGGTHSGQGIWGQFHPIEVPMDANWGSSMGCRAFKLPPKYYWGCQVILRGPQGSWGHARQGVQ